MTDPMKALAAANHLQATSEADRLNDMAEDMEANIDKKGQARVAQEYYDEIMSDDVVTFDELENLHRLMDDAGIVGDDQSFWNEQGRVRGAEDASWDFSQAEADAAGSRNSGFSLAVGDESDEAQGDNLQFMETFEGEIDNFMDSLEDNEQTLQFELQMATSDMQNAESVRAQAYKKMDEQRDKGVQAWA
jgi:hypothetical protein